MAYKPGTGQKIETLYAWIAREADGGEGLCAAMTKDGTYMPLIGANPERVESFRKLAREIERMSGQPVSLVRFSTREVLEGPALDA